MVGGKTTYSGSYPFSIMTANDTTLNKRGPLPVLAGQEAQKVVLGANEVPVFMFIGDSTSVGWTSKWDPDATDGEAWAVYRNAPSNEVPAVGSLTLANTPVYGKIWSKFQQHVTGTPDKVDRGIREITSNSSYTPSWQNADVRMGGGALQHGDPASSLFDYDHEAGTYNNKAIIGSPVWSFLQGIHGLFVDSNDDPVLPHIIYLGKASSRFTAGTNTAAWKTAWNEGTGTGSSDLQASNGCLYEFYKEYYVKPSINDLRDDSKIPLMAGLIVACGGNDAGIAINNILEPGLGDDMWNLAAGYFEDMKDDLCTYIGIDDIPTVAYIPWRPDDETVADLDGIKTIRDDFISMFSDSTGTFANGHLIDPYKLRRDSPSHDGDSDGIHFTPVGTMSLGAMYAAGYRTLLRNNRKTLVAESVDSDIT